MLRQDPDIIMIGEIRDDETARIGIRAALTGVLVFSTLHGSDAPSTISNLYNFGIPGYQLSSSLLAIVSQRLIRKICPYCRVTYAADEKMLQDDGDRSRRASAIFVSTAAWAARRASRPAISGGPGFSRSWSSARSCATWCSSRFPKTCCAESRSIWECEL